MADLMKNDIMYYRKYKEKYPEEAKNMELPYDV